MCGTLTCPNERTGNIHSNSIFPPLDFVYSSFRGDCFLVDGTRPTLSLESPVTFLAGMRNVSPLPLLDAS